MLIMGIRKKYSELCELIWNSDDKTRDKLDVILDALQTETPYTQYQIKLIRKKLQKTFLQQFNKKYQKSRRRPEFFKSYNQDFLEKEFIFDNNDLEEAEPEVEHNIKSKVGRPQASHEDCSRSTKYRRASELASNYSAEELTLALKQKNRLEKNTDESDNDDGVLEMRENRNDPDRYEILAMYIDSDLSKQKYLNLRQHNKNLLGHCLYPTYSSLINLKKTCYPENVEVTEKGAEVDIFSLLEHTTKRILETLNDKKINEIKNKKLTLLGKWGMDGASGQQKTRQKWLSEVIVEARKVQEIHDESNSKEDEATSDGSSFLVTFSPLQLKAENEVIWQNPKPNSTLYCRPIKFSFHSESNKLVMETYEYYTMQLNKVKTYCFEFSCILFEIDFDIKFTMSDGKVHNIISGQRASNSCNICLVGPKNINKISYVINLEKKTEFYKLGLCTLHCWIRTMEYILHISYSIGSKKSIEYENNIYKKKAAKKLS